MRKSDKKRIANILWGMKARCYNPNSIHYKYYGGKGVTVCQGWWKSDGFIAWAEVSGYQPGLTIDRINGDGNYEPGNCRWATMQEQNANRKRAGRYPRQVTHNGETHALGEWLDIMGISLSAFNQRKKNGLTGDALFAPKFKREPPLLYFGRAASKDFSLQEQA